MREWVQNGHSFGWSSEWLLSHASDLVADLHYAAPLSEIAEAAVHDGPAFAQSAIWDRFAVWSRIWAGLEEDLRRCSLRGVPGRRFIHPKQIGEKVRAYLANLDRGLRESRDVIPYRRRERLTGVALDECRDSLPFDDIALRVRQAGCEDRIQARLFTGRQKE